MIDLQNDLIDKAQQHDAEAQNQLIIENKQVVAQVARKYFLLGGDQDDLLQEGMIGLYFAINSYDKTQGVDFKKYARIIIERQILNAIKSDNTQKNFALNKSLGLSDNENVVFNGAEETSFALPSDVKNPESILLEIEGEQSLIGQIEKVLSDYEIRVLRLHLIGKKQSDIAKEINETTKSVENALTRIKNKLQFLKGDRLV